MKKLVYALLFVFVTTMAFSSCRETKTENEVEDGIEEVGEDIEDGAEEVGDEMEDAVDD